jgi:CarD family transcriptional regulator
MSTRKKTPKKSSRRSTKAIPRSTKSSSTSKAKDTKISAKIAKTARAVKKAAPKSAKAPARAASKAKAKVVRSKASRATAASKTSAKASKTKTMSAKLHRAKPAAGASQRSVVRAKESAALAAAKKKTEIVKKEHEKLPVTGHSKQSHTAAMGEAEKTIAPVKATAPAAAPEAAPAPAPKPAKPTAVEKPAAAEPAEVVVQKAAKSGGGNRHGFKTNEFIVYPAHGVGQIVAIEEQEVAGFKLELFVITFVKDKMTLRVPTGKVTGVGMRKLAEPEAVKRALDILLGRARIKRTMWSRRAQEYETKINSGDLAAISEVVRDLYRSEAQPEQSYSERQLYEAALDRMAREVAVVQRLTESEALKAIDAQLQRGQRRGAKAEADAAAPGGGETDVEEAA